MLNEQRPGSEATDNIKWERESQGRLPRGRHRDSHLALATIPRGISEDTVRGRFKLCKRRLTSYASQLPPTALPGRTCSWFLWVSWPLSSPLPSCFLEKVQPCWDYCELQVKGQTKPKSCARAMINWKRMQIWSTSPLALPSNVQPTDLRSPPLGSASQIQLISREMKVNTQEDGKSSIK